jgi:hypothetical protein
MRRMPEPHNFFEISTAPSAPLNFRIMPAGAGTLHSKFPPKTSFTIGLGNPPDSYRDGIGSSTETTHTALLGVQPKVFDQVQFLGADFGGGNIQQRQCAASPPDRRQSGRKIGLNFGPPVPNHHAIRNFQLVRSGGAPPFLSREKVEHEYTCKQGKHKVLGVTFLGRAVSHSAYPALCRPSKNNF